MSAFQDLIHSLLPCRTAQITAGLTIPVSGVIGSMPHFFNPMIPNASQAEVVLAQVVCALLAFSVGTLVTLGFTVRWAKAEAQKFSAQVQQQHKQAFVAGPVIDPKDAEVTEDMFLILLFLAENENRTPDEVAEFLNIGKPLAHHLLESLQSKALVNDKHMPGSAWAGSKYRNEWFCTSAGRSYLASRKVLK